MKMRHVTTVAMTVALLAGGLFAQGTRMDTVTRRDGKILPNVVVLKETASEVELDTDGDKKPDQTLAQDEVKSIMYGDAPIEYTRAHNFYRVRQYDKAIAGFGKVDLTKTRKWVKDYSTYYIAMCYARKADSDPAQRARAVEKLDELLTDDENRWRDSARYQLGQIYLVSGDKAKALETFNKLASGAHKPEMKLTASVGLGDILMAEARATDALGKYETVVKNAKGKFRSLYISGMVGKAKAMTVLEQYDEVVKFLREILEDEKNDTLCAKGYLALADCYYAQAASLQEPKKAKAKYKWALKNYLWNIVVYSNQKAEYAKALYYAADCWDKLDDPSRAKSLRTELRKNCRSSEWAKRLDTGN